MKRLIRSITLLLFLSFLVIVLSNSKVFGYGNWHIFVPVHIVSAVIALILFVFYFGSSEQGGRDAFKKELRIPMVGFTLIFLALGPASILAIAGAMVDHKVTYGKFNWE